MTLKRQKTTFLSNMSLKRMPERSFQKSFLFVRPGQAKAGLNQFFLRRTQFIRSRRKMRPKNFSYIYSISQRRIQACVYFVLVCLVRPYITFQANVFFARVKNSAVYVTVLEIRLNIIYAWSILYF